MLAMHVTKVKMGLLLFVVCLLFIVAELLLMEMHNELFLVPVKHSLGRYVVIVGRATRREFEWPK